MQQVISLIETSRYGKLQLINTVALPLSKSYSDMKQRQLASQLAYSVYQSLCNEQLQEEYDNTFFRQDQDGFQFDADTLFQGLGAYKAYASAVLYQLLTGIKIVSTP